MAALAIPHTSEKFFKIRSLKIDFNVIDFNPLYNL